MTALARPTLASMAASLLLAMLAVACSGDAKKDATPVASSGSPSAEDATPAPKPTVPVTYASPGPVTFSVLAGHTDGNIDVEMFMPADVRLRAGDTIEWTAHGFEGHTITFGNLDEILPNANEYLLPDPANPVDRIFNPKIALKSDKQGTHDGDGAYINSGFIGVPVEAKYSLTFTKAGLYTYLCTVHPFTMSGTVTVEPSGAQVESPQTVRARGDAQAARYTEELRAQAAHLRDEVQSAPGPGTSAIHYVQVGAITDRGQAAVYTPGSLDINAGDNVIFENDDRNFHNVIFKGARELPAGVGILVDPGGRGINFILKSDSAAAADPPPGGFDDKTFLSSGSLGVLQPRLTWTVKFDKAGTYQYACTIHVLAGMVGVIEVH